MSSEKKVATPKTILSDGRNLESVYISESPSKALEVDVKSPKPSEAVRSSKSVVNDKATPALLKPKGKVVKKTLTKKSRKKGDVSAVKGSKKRLVKKTDEKKADEQPEVNAGDEAVNVTENLASVEDGKSNDVVGKAEKPIECGTEKNDDAEGDEKVKAVDESPMRGSSAKRRRLRKKRKQSVLQEEHQNEGKNGGRTPRSKHDKDKNVVGQNENEKEKLGGLIFMCSSKTKSDCFHYRVMGLPASQQDLVTRVKPGHRLFLFDIDSKLLYGVFKASSPGGMKLEPKAFAGGYPAQVKFATQEDCHPLPESVLREDFNEIYNSRNKFKTELTFGHVKKLVKLFHRNVASPNRPRQPPQRAEIRDREMNVVLEPRRELYLRDIEQDRRVRPRTATSRERNEYRDTFLSEREYQEYGLVRERAPISPPRNLAPPIERVYEEDQLGRHIVPKYSSVLPSRELPLHYASAGGLEPSYMPPRAVDDSYYPRAGGTHFSYGSSSLTDQYARDYARIGGAVDPRSRQADELERFARYASGVGAAGYSGYRVGEPDPVGLPASSRYLPGGSSLYR